MPVRRSRDRRQALIDVTERADPYDVGIDAHPSFRVTVAVTCTEFARSI